MHFSKKFEYLKKVFENVLPEEIRNSLGEASLLLGAFRLSFLWPFLEPEEAAVLEAAPEASFSQSVKPAVR